MIKFRDCHPVYGWRRCANDKRTIHGIDFSLPLLQGIKTDIREYIIYVRIELEDAISWTTEALLHEEQSGTPLPRFGHAPSRSFHARNGLELRVR